MGARNAGNVPSDAGEHAAGLAALLARIADDADRYLGCGPGWYPILSEFEERLATVDPTCTLSTVQEIDGRLSITVHSCREGAASAVKAAIALARRQSEFVCEFSGRRGVLMERDGHLRTLSPVHAPKGYRLVEPSDNDLRVAHLTAVLSETLQEMRNRVP